MQNLLKNHADKLRFGLVGAANTTIDFGILFGLVFLGIDKLVANFISTGIAFIFSFFVNKSFTFKQSGKASKKQFGLFLVITLTGLWVIQPVIISLTNPVLTGAGLNASLSLLTGKLLATVATLIWNYILYKRFVFKAAS
jgi:putative flippase GtrA